MRPSLEIVMTSKHAKEQRRKEKLRVRAKANKARSVIVRDGDKRTLIQQISTKGYDVPMLRDFIDHLLLEVRVQHYENQKLLNSLNAIDNLDQALKVASEISPKLVEQLRPFQKKYLSALITCNVIDRTNAREAEAKVVITVLIKQLLARRDEQIGHLEALRELFEEALNCAKMPFGLDQNGHLVQPLVVHSVREIADAAFLASLPKYEDLLPQFSGHVFANEEGIEVLRNHDRSMPIVASNEAYEKMLPLYVPESLAQASETDQGTVQLLDMKVSSFTELQFVIAAIAKYVGPPCTDGHEWSDL